MNLGHLRSDTYANESTSFQIITGSNMSGKSTLLRQIALLHVMAQARFSPSHFLIGNCLIDPI